MLATSFWVDCVYDFFTALEAILSERKQDLILLVAVAKKGTDMASIAKYRGGAPHRPPALIRVFLGELSLIVRLIHRGALFQNHHCSTLRVLRVKLLGFNCSEKNTQPDDFHSRIRDKSKPLNAQFSKDLKIMEDWLK
jgi:hypothetical protein